LPWLDRFSYLPKVQTIPGSHVEVPAAGSSSFGQSLGGPLQVPFFPSYSQDGIKSDGAQAPWIVLNLTNDGTTGLVSAQLSENTISRQTWSQGTRQILVKFTTSAIHQQARERSIGLAKRPMKYLLGPEIGEQ
jgi:hypothetical protein